MEASDCSPPPIHGSIPMHSELPSFKCQARPDLMKGIVCRIVFQTIEMTDLGQTGRRIQSKICYNQMYLWYVIVVQRFCVVRSVQLILAARASAKTDDPLVPIPPIFLVGKFSSSSPKKMFFFLFVCSIDICNIFAGYERLFPEESNQVTSSI